jgi:DNA processing protein
MASGKGLIIAESKIGSKPLSQHFPQRNRLISGLSLGVLVVEANLKSGSLITSRFALEQNREVFAVPGFPLDPRCKGTNSLLKDGAHLVESTEDILSELSNFNLQKKAFEEEIKDDNNYTHLSISNIQAVSNEMRQTVVDLLSSTPTSLTLIVEATGFPLQLIHLIILELELAGRIARMPGNMISLIY